MKRTQGQRQICLNIPAELYEAIVDVARDGQMSMAAAIRAMLSDSVEAKTGSALSYQGQRP